MRQIANLRFDVEASNGGGAVPEAATCEAIGMALLWANGYPVATVAGVRETYPGEVWEMTYRGRVWRLTVQTCHDFVSGRHEPYRVSFDYLRDAN